MTFIEPEEHFEVCKFFSKQVYDSIIISEYTTQQAEKWTLIKTLLNNDYRPYIKDNFVCCAYKKDNDIIIAFRGTDDLKDIFADMRFLVKETPRKSVKYAREYYNKIKKENPGCKFIFTGHSLGGAYAEIISYQLAKEKDEALKGAITFNAPGTDYLFDEKETEIREYLKQIVSNYVIMNDYVGNFQAHVGNTYYFQPYLLNKYCINNVGEKERETAHGCILNYNIKDFGPRYQHSKEFGTKEAWALWVYDVNNTNPNEKLIKKALDNLMRVKTQDLEKAISIINYSDIKLLNSFHYQTDVEPYDLLSYEETIRLEELQKKQQEKVSV